jgi:hypothetical protein
LPSYSIAPCTGVVNTAGVEVPKYNGAVPAVAVPERRVSAPDAVIWLLNVIVPDAPETAEPILIFVVEPDAPAVPMFTVFVLPLRVAPVIKLAVALAVVPAIVKVVAAAAIVIVVGVASRARVAAFEFIAGEFKFIEVEDTRFAVAVLVAFPIATAEAFVPPIVIVPKAPVPGLAPTSMVMFPDAPVLEPPEPVEIVRFPELPDPPALAAPVVSVIAPEVFVPPTFPTAPVDKVSAPEVPFEAVAVPVDRVVAPETAAESPDRIRTAPVVPEVVVVPVKISIAPELADVVFAVKKSRSVVPVPPVTDVIPVRAKLPVVLFSATEVVPINRDELPSTVDVRVPVTFAAGMFVRDAPEPINVVPVTVPGKEVFPEPSSRVAVLVSVVNTPVYCLT